jgi:hypothetical protein
MSTLGCLVSSEVWDVGTYGAMGSIWFRSFVPVGHNLYSGGHQIEAQLHRLMQGGWFIDARQVAFTTEAPDPADNLTNYVRFWVLHGARVGVRVGDEMHWGFPKTTSKVPILPCACWKDTCVGCSRPRHFVDRDPTSLVTRAREPFDPYDDCPECKQKGDLTRIVEAVRK